MKRIEVINYHEMSTKEIQGCITELERLISQSKYPEMIPEYKMLLAQAKHAKEYKEKQLNQR